MSDNEESDTEEDDTTTSAAYASARPSGVLSVHTMLLRDIDRTHVVDLPPEPEVYVRIRVGSNYKSTKTVVVEKEDKILVDDIKHFSLKVSRNRSDPSNEIRFDLILVESPHIHRLVGHKDMHLYDVIKNLFAAGSHTLMYRKQTVATLELEMCFTYGIFGYGCCHQLRNRQKKVSDIVSHSLLLRVEPPEGRGGGVMTAIPIGHPAFISFPVKADFDSTSESSDLPGGIPDTAVGLESHEPIILMRTMKKRMHRIQSDFSGLGSRVQRKRFLEKLILNQVHDRETAGDDTVHEGSPSTGSAVPTRDHDGAEIVQVEAETYGTDSDYANSATDLKELMSSVLMNAPGLVRRNPPNTHLMATSLLDIGEEENVVEDMASCSTVRPPMGSNISTKVGTGEASSKSSTVPQSPPPSPDRSTTTAASEPRRRSTLTDLPGLFLQTIANRLTAWRTARSRPPVPSPRAPVVLKEEDAGPSDSSAAGSFFSIARFRKTMLKQEP